MLDIKENWEIVAVILQSYFSPLYDLECHAALISFCFKDLQYLLNRNVDVGGRGEKKAS